MTRIMRDAIIASHIPISGTDMVAGYANGHWPWLDGDWNIFPHVPHIVIDVFGTDIHADVLDVETGDATVQVAVEWVRSKLKLQGSYPPVIYCNRSTLTPLFNAMGTAGYKVGTHFKTWIATLDGTMRVADMAGVTAVQFKDYGGYDESMVYDDNWKAVKIVSTPGPTAQEIAKAVVQEMDAAGNRDYVAMAVVFWLRRILDPSITLPNASVQPGKQLTEDITAIRKILGGKL